jgi:septal ring factor EnvC (AmiA/AmiB activator)
MTLVAMSLARGQDARIREQRAELDRIRLERAQLEQQMRELQTSAHDLSAEVVLLDRRADATTRIVRTLDKQLAAIATEVDLASQDMVRAESELAAKHDILRHRVVEIYKRGPMFTAQALLSARSFGELVARYKYLHMLALRDASLVRRVQTLRNQVALERDRLVALQTNLEDSKADKQMETRRLRALEQQQKQQLTRVQGQARLTGNRLARARQTEEQMANAIAELEIARRRAESARPAGSAAVASSIRPSDYGTLSWPVDGALVYTFGRAVQANSTTIRWNGVGIRASVGTPVKSVAAGHVVRVSQLGTYGLTVIVEHGGGDYSIYGSLSRSDVTQGQAVTRGQVIGGVGISDPELPPHLHFEIRHGGPAVDPAIWLRQR